MMSKSRMTGKVMAGVMCAAMLLAVPVYAENEETKDMQVTYTAADTYTLSIPSTITLDAANGATDTLGVANANIQPGKVLNIKITTNTVLLKRKGDAVNSEKKVTSVITAGQTDISGASSENPVTIGTYEGTITQEAKKQTITFGAPQDADNDNIIDAGTYTGTIIFKAAIENVTSPDPGDGN